MKYYVIAGEPSGDLHAANLIKAIKKEDPQAEFRAWGGELMEAQGAEIVKHYRDLAFMGFVEVLMNIRTILRNMKWCKTDIEAYQPDAVILIDYPGFNLRIAEHVKSLNIPVHYYISPQIWAWKQSRVHKIKKVVDHLYAILPFEKAFYEKFDYTVDFVGHPLLDAMEIRSTAITTEAWKAKHQLAEKPIIALLPGSRKQEISVKLPIMLSVASAFPEYQFAVGMAPSQTRAFYESIVGNANVGLITDDTYGLLEHSDAGLITSGTATLEAALLDLPEVVCYKGSAISYAIGKRLVKIKFISLVNLILDREAVTELIQHDLTKANLIKELELLLRNKEHRQKVLDDYTLLKTMLGGKGASERCAKLIVARLR